MRRKKSSFVFAGLLAVLVAVSLACSMPAAVATQAPADAVATANASAATALPSNGGAQATVAPSVPTQRTPSGGLPATPTQAPSSPAGASGAQAGTPPRIANVRSTDKGYYQNGCGNTTLTFSADVSDAEGDVARVWVTYRLMTLEAPGVGSMQWYQMDLQPQGGGHYEGVLDLTRQGPSELQGYNGTLEYQIYAQDNAGNLTIEPDGYVYGAEALACQQQAGGQLSVSNITLYPQGEVYYGQCGSEETMLNIQATLEPMDKISVAEVHYAYSNATDFQGGYTVTMYQLGIGDFAADINVGAEANAVLNGGDGQIEYYIHAETTDGQVLETNWASFPVHACQGVAVGNPPIASFPTIHNFTGPDYVAPGDAVVLEWEVQDACKVFLDGHEVNAIDTYIYTVPSNEGDTTYTHTLAAWGSSCDNTTEQTATVTVQVQASGGGNNGGNAGGNMGVVRFYNNASHPVVELVIDGQEVILSEAQSIPVGGYLDVNVPDGSHNYQAGLGFWQGGVKNAIYPLPAGSFNAQDGSVTLNDPSLGEMLTNYGQGGYYAGTYWDENALVHCAAFDFNASGGFDFYLDGQYDESGSYTLLSRDPSTYSVTFRVVGSNSGEQFDGTFFYTGALAGTIQMDNGPSSWRTIEYVLNGSCP